MVSFRAHLAAVIALCAVSAAQGSTNIADWLAAQSKLNSWTAEFTQTRTLKALVHPLTNEGRIWFQAPNNFRWELGTPAQTIALRTTNELLLIYPRLKRAERYPASAQAGGGWGDMLAVLEDGFPRAQADIDAKFRILSITTAESNCLVRLEPRSPQARRFIPEIVIGFDTNNYALMLTELKFADGSTLRNDFKAHAVNPRIDKGQFEAAIDPSFKIVEPLKGSKR